MTGLYDFRPSLQIGFHGCDEKVRDSLVNNPFEVKISEEKYDWLGSGFYVWENNYTRAMEWAADKAYRERAKGNDFTPSVVGVVYLLGNCLDLTDSKFTELLAGIFEPFKDHWNNAGLILPENRDLKSDEHHDLILRERDCAVINFLHAFIRKRPNLTAFDTVRGTFSEGCNVYEGSGFRMKTHTQICIRNMDCIKAFFIPKVNTVN